MSALILHSHNTPNGHKVSIALEELGLEYETRVVDVRAGEQFADAFVDLNPNAKIPVLEDRDAGLTIAESNAILLYLAEKTSRLAPTDLAGRARMLELLFFQAASIGPMFGQRAHFAFAGPEPVPYAIKRYEEEGARLHGVLERYLQRSGEWFLEAYSICDIAIYGWLHCAVAMGFDVKAQPALEAWRQRMAARPAVARGVAVPGPLPDFPQARRAA